MNPIKADINPAEFTTKDKVSRVVVSNRTFRLKGMKPWIALNYEQQGPIIGGNCHKYHFCRDKQVFVKTKYVFCDKKYVCRDKHTFGATKDVFCRDKDVFVATKLILVATPATDRDLNFDTRGIATMDPGRDRKRESYP